MSKPSDLVRGTLDMLLLKILKREAHNWGRLSEAISRVVKLKEADAHSQPNGGTNATSTLGVHDSIAIALVISPKTSGPGIGR